MPVVDPIVGPSEDVLEPAVPSISDEDVFKLYELSQPYVEKNFYLGTPMDDLAPDWNVTDSHYGNPSTTYHSLDVFEAYIKQEYFLSNNFADRLLDSSSSILYEHDENVYVVAANRGSNIEVGNEIKRVIIPEGDARIILRVTHETVDDTSGEWKVTGSFDVDNVLIYEDGRWVWDDIAEFR